MRALRALVAALAYFTVIPLPRALRSADPPGPGALASLPFVGALVGVIAGCCGVLVARILPGFGGIAAWIVAIALTGAIHVDGFLDCCDALFASTTPQRRLEILRDPHHGSFAIAGMVMLAAVWLAAVVALPVDRLPLALALTGALGRLAAIANAWLFPYARPDVTPPAFAKTPSIVAFDAALVLTGVLAWLWSPFYVALLPIAVLAGIATAYVASRRLGGGITGDVYGAVAVVTEVAMLLALHARPL